MATFLTYDGSAKDHRVIPEILSKGKDGKPMKRKIVKESSLEYFPVEVYKLWGYDFPTGEPVEVSAQDVKRGIVKKAQALKCFSVSDGSKHAEAVVPEPVVVDVVAVADEAPTMKRRGRPRKDD